MENNEVINYLENLCKDVEAELYIEKAKAVIMFNYDNSAKIDDLTKRKLVLESAIDMLKK